MQPMSDKELDELFQQRFGSFDAEPSAAVWNKITNELDNKKGRKKSFPIFWMAAASVVVVLGLGVYLFNPKETIKLRGKAVAEQVTVTPEAPVELPVIEQPSIALNTPANMEEELTSVKKQPQKTRIAIEPKKALPIQTVAETVKSLEKHPAIVSEEIIVPEKTDSSMNTNADNKLILAAISTDIDSNDKQVREIQRRKITSIGSLVNFVVARVDRREDKIIEFTDNGEGSEITGINLGLVKIKSRNK